MVWFGGVNWVGCGKLGGILQYRKLNRVQFLWSSE